METILIVDDEKNYHLPLTALFQAEGYETVSAYSGKEAWEIIATREVDLVLSDMTMPEGDGLELLGRLKGSRPEIPVLMLTAFGTVELAVEAMKLGAFDYLTKPCPNDEMLRKVAKALELGRLGRQNRELRSALTQRYSFGRLIGKSRPMLELYKVLEKVAPTKANVLITGESGTGKELVAQALHYNSPRADESFVAVNCSALSPTLLESELFGHEKGAFTDARAAKSGRFELANGGTLFLDEIGEMDQGLQVKLLRVLQERRFERVGGTQSIGVDVRLVAATNRDLKGEVAAGHFREDLFYRLNVVHLHLPPLRERLDDLPLLTGHFLKMYGEEGGSVSPTLSREALRLLFAYSWPGNVRELGNVIERGIVLSFGPEIQPEDLPEDIRRPAPAFHIDPEAMLLSRQATTAYYVPSPPGGSISPPVSLWVSEALKMLPEGLTLEDAVSALEEGLLRAALAENGGVQARAAQALGLKKNVFKYKWDKYIGRKPGLLVAALVGEVPAGVELVAALEALEEALLKDALKRCGGVQSQAADLLGIKKNLMQYKLKKFDIDPRA
ncbi:MAG: sigma 54-interacting transcriptional regulator [Candidatus Adiutrix intracellularis]|jgi:two-component system NtrC family response regulator|nr:sigma 54-interacting transcriptional regulator [Candidatus Adiutrix intracellularis]